MMTLGGEFQADWSVKAEVVRWVDNEPQPGIVACGFLDKDGRAWTFVGKYYDFSDEELRAESTYPRPGLVRCLVLERKTDESGREIVVIDTDSPARGIASEEGRSVFEVYPDQLVPSPIWQHWFAEPLTIH